MGRPRLTHQRPSYWLVLPAISRGGAARPKRSFSPQPASGAAGDRFAARRTADYFFLVLWAERATRAPRFHARAFLPPNIPGPD
jgi:hypothetical protein